MTVKFCNCCETLGEETAGKDELLLLLLWIGDAGGSMDAGALALWFMSSAARSRCSQLLYLELSEDGTSLQ